MIIKWLIGPLAVSVFSTMLVTQEKTLTTDEVINKYVEAAGGYKRLKAVQSMKLTGQYTYRGWDYPLTILRTRPSYLRIETLEAEKRDIVAFDGEDVWKIEESRSMEQAIVQDPRTKAFVKAYSDFDGALVDYNTKGHVVELVDVEDVDGEKAFNIEVTLKNGKTENWYIDCSSFLLVKRSAKIMRRNREVTQEAFYMNYKRVNGLMIPYYVERLDAPHYVRGYEITTVEINPAIDAGLFKMLSKE